MLGPHTHRDNPLSRRMCAPIAPPVTVRHTMKIWLRFCFSGNFFSIPRAKKCNEKTNTGEGGKGKRGRTVSDDVPGKSLSEASKRKTADTSSTLDHLGRDQQRGHTHTTHTHTLPPHSLTHPYIVSFLGVSHTNTNCLKEWLEDASLICLLEVPTTVLRTSHMKFSVPYLRLCEECSGCDRCLFFDSSKRNA